MQEKFHTTIDKIHSFADKLGKKFNNKSNLAITGVVFVFSLVIFGSLIFVSSFVKSSLGIKDEE